MIKKYFYIISINIYCLTSVLFAQSVQDTLSFIHISDTHICSLGGYDSSFVKDHEEYGESFAPLKNFIRIFPAKVEADAIVISGDIIDYYEAETVNDNLKAKQIEYFIPLLELVTVPIFLTLGNHDMASYWMDETKGKIKSQFNTMEAKANWIRKVPLFKKGTYYTREFKVSQTSYLFIFLEVGFKSDDGLRGYWDTPQLRWLQYQLDESSDKKVVLFFHIPLPVGDTNKDGVHFKTPPQEWPFADTYDKGIFKILNTEPNIVAAIVGHGHNNVIEMMPLPAGHEIMQVQTASFGQDPNNWRIIHFMEKKISVTAPGVETIEKDIEW